jgi:hypothetical protein
MVRPRNHTAAGPRPLPAPAPSLPPRDAGPRIIRSRRGAR